MICKNEEKMYVGIFFGGGPGGIVVGKKIQALRIDRISSLLL